MNVNREATLVPYSVDKAGVYYDAGKYRPDMGYMLLIREVATEVFYVAYLYHGGYDLSYGSLEPVAFDCWCYMPKPGIIVA